MANYEKMYDLFDLAFWMQETSEGLSLDDIQRKYKISRRTGRGFLSPPHHSIGTKHRINPVLN